MGVDAVVGRRLIALMLAGALLLGGLSACNPGSDSGTPGSSSAGRPSGADAGSEAAAVKATYDRYVSAALARDGVQATAQLSASTVAFYDEMRQDALTLPKEELSGRTPVQQVTIMVMRAEIDVAELESLSPEGVLAKTFDLGLVGETGVANTQLEDVQVRGDVALGDALTPRGRLESAFTFLREEGGWKLDLESFTDRGNAGLVALAEQEGLTTTEFVDRFVRTKYGEGAVARLREPLKPA